MFCPFIKDDCRTDCVFFTEKETTGEPECRIEVASTTLSTVDKWLCDIYAILDKIEDKCDK